MSKKAKATRNPDEMSVSQVVSESGFCENTVRSWIQKGALPHVRRGASNRIRVLRADFLRVVLKQSV